MKTTRKSKALSAADTQRLLASEPPIPIGHIPVDPIGMKTIAMALRNRFISQGGRPSDPTWTISRKVPMRPDTWKELERLARSMHERSIRVSPGQLAAIALERGLSTDASTEQATGVFTSFEHVGVRAAYAFSAEVRVEARQMSRAIAEHGLW